MMGLNRKILKYEFLNIIRSRWILFFSILLFVLSFALIQITGDYEKSLVALLSITSVLVPLVALFFTTVSWYYSDRFTELLLTQPIPRRQIFFARVLSLIASLSLCSGLAPAVPFLIRGYFSMGLLSWMGSVLFLSAVFTLMGLWVGISVADRIKGIGAAFGLWLYFTLIHDGVTLLVLVFFKDYPMDWVAALIGCLNPIGLVRVVLLTIFDSALLLGHTGAIVREFMLGLGGQVVSLGIAGLWISIPTLFAYKKFNSRDF